MKSKKAIMNWSGGKDSSLALYHCLQDPEIDVRYLVTTINDAADRISMHGVRVELLIRQAESIGIPLYQVRLPEMPDMETYDNAMRHHVEFFKSEGITHSIFGDIFLEDLKSYRDRRLTEAGLTGIYPLWKRDTRELIKEFFDLGFGTVIACTQEKLGRIAGQELSPGLIKTLPPDIDVCGENGEFHTFAFSGPIFKSEIKYRLGEKVFKVYTAPKTDRDNSDSPGDDKLSGFWYQDLILA
ncbi:diphthine--ammonia ligase [Mucilaginibacter sp. L3T2-6]|uniref:Dph6-related ATP pyrophosphatase n=1 Tax=Mucilaginibacter sp. L3T2-6 TaxID=3062491 RepID=UPI00267478C2|nr:diphthine--ammonia ligase [Mucilaginibacter sp. L3T2-6]MDO3642823.1 diphthine--ammonia ligase [Mucilaginibacter sp. L3T2-6]MDV6215148.1 diphthine--ammonia ligase [Mucilaginibacter sp. L3T2-6]